MTAKSKKKKGKQFKSIFKQNKTGFQNEQRNKNPFENAFLEATGETDNLGNSKKFTKKKHTLLVRKLPASITKKELKDHFCQFFEIKKLKIFNKNSEEKMYALLAFKKRKDVMWILKNPNTHTLGDTELECRLAIEEDEYDSIQKRQQDALFTIFLNKVPKSASEQDLTDYFSKFGDIKSVCLINKNKVDSNEKKFGFVLFEVVESVKLALAQKSHSINNQSLSCTRYWPKERNVKSVIISKKGMIIKEAEDDKDREREREKEIEMEEEVEEIEQEEDEVEVEKGKRIFTPVEQKTEAKIVPSIVWILGNTERKFRFIGILNICEKLKTRHKKMLKLPNEERLPLLRLNKPHVEEEHPGFEEYHPDVHPDVYQHHVDHYDHVYDQHYHEDPYYQNEAYYQEAGFTHDYDHGVPPMAEYHDPYHGHQDPNWHYHQQQQPGVGYAGEGYHYA